MEPEDIIKEIGKPIDCTGKVEVTELYEGVAEADYGKYRMRINLDVKNDLVNYAYSIIRMKHLEEETTECETDCEMALDVIDLTNDSSETEKEEIKKEDEFKVGPRMSKRKQMQEDRRRRREDRIRKTEQRMDNAFEGYESGISGWNEKAATSGWKSLLAKRL